MGDQRAAGLYPDSAPIELVPWIPTECDQEYQVFAGYFLFVR